MQAVIKEHLSKQWPNTPFQPMPLRGGKNGAILAVRSGYNTLSI